MITDHVLTRAKAYAALVGSVLTVLGSTLPSDPTTQKWLGLALALCTAVATFTVPNQTQAERAAKRGAHEAGNVDVLLLLAVLTFIGVVLLLFRVHFR